MSGDVDKFSVGYFLFIPSVCFFPVFMVFKRIYSID